MRTPQTSIQTPTRTLTRTFIRFLFLIPILFLIPTAQAAREVAKPNSGGTQNSGPNGYHSMPNLNSQRDPSTLEFEIPQSGSHPRPEANQRNEIQVCYLKGLGKDGGIAQVTGLCNVGVNNSGKGLAVAINSKFKEMLAKPFIVSRGNTCKTGPKNKMSSESAKNIFKSELRERVQQMCAEQLCEERGLGKFCPETRRLINVNDAAFDKILNNLLGVEPSCEPQEITEIHST